MLKILESPYVYQASVLFTHGSLAAFKKNVSEEAGFSDNGRTLDVCCGTGNFAGIVRGEYFGFDLNEKYIDYARKRFALDRSKNFFVKDVNEAGFETGYFDNSMIISALHHFSDEEAGRLLAVISRVTRGRVIITDPESDDRSLISRALVGLDRGSYMRSKDAEISLVTPFFDVEKIFSFHSGLAHVRMIVCKAKKR